jgi:hypothetical protein
MNKLFLLIIGTSALLLAGCSTTHRSARWEYREAGSLEQANALGTDGWEVVGFNYTSAGSTVYLLKRPGN